MYQHLPSILIAVGILVIGWFVALLIRAGSRRILGKFSVNQRFHSEINLESGISTGLYYFTLLVSLIAFFNSLQLEQVSSSLQTLIDPVVAFLPKIIAGAVILVLAWGLATIARTLASRALSAKSLGNLLSKEAGTSPVNESLATVVYWLIILLFLPAVLRTVGMTGLLEPVQAMIDKMLALLPNIMGAAAIGFVGWFVARTLRIIVASLLAATGIDEIGENAGVGGKMKLSGLVGLVIYIFVLVPALIAAFETLGIETISDPATKMLESLMSAVPDIIAAAIILGVALIMSKFISSIVSSLLNGVGFDKVPERLGLAQAIPAGASVSKIVGRVLVFFIMLFAFVEAAQVLGFTQVSDMVSTLISFGAQVVLGLIIIMVGYWLSNLANRAVLNVSGQSSAVVANIIRYAILGIILAMGLRAMGLANEIVDLAFGLVLGAVAVAVALAFGLGGREAAGRQMEHWLSRLRGDN